MFTFSFCFVSIAKQAKLFFLFLILVWIVYKNIKKTFPIEEISKIDEPQIANSNSKSNIINEVSYQSYDANGNEYLINALKGEIDLSDSDIIFLTNVNAKINLKDSNSGSFFATTVV